MPYRLSITTQGQLIEIEAASIAQWGDRAADRYQDLLYKVFDELGRDPFPLGHEEISADPEILGYHICHSRTHLPLDQRVREPRHIVVYCTGPNGTTDIFGLAYDTMELDKVARRLVGQAVF
ncbi:hypothetical protein [Telmatospirillum sp.]|uniref:hypothetical protein n=1 Tax=Telmatospirillum sp. TaxID=2079197 RepID=UPI002845D450|nr:hypothetical protein [Telmatospirillum sp.]MDR3435544.1 hypothetical protein [Telmatospirillum sp.]